MVHPTLHECKLNEKCMNRWLKTVIRLFNYEITVNEGGLIPELPKLD